MPMRWRRWGRKTPPTRIICQKPNFVTGFCNSPAKAAPVSRKPVPEAAFVPVEVFSENPVLSVLGLDKLAMGGFLALAVVIAGVRGRIYGCCLPRLWR